MAIIQSFSVEYDEDADVLYIGALGAAASQGVQDRYGFVWRYDGTGSPIGVTVVDFEHFWREKRETLERELAKHFSVTQAYASDVIDQALDHIGPHNGPSFGP